jgi:hypothetical protein
MGILQPCISHTLHNTLDKSKEEYMSTLPEAMEYGEDRQIMMIVFNCIDCSIEMVALVVDRWLGDYFKSSVIINYSQFREWIRNNTKERDWDIQLIFLSAERGISKSILEREYFNIAIL